MSRGKGNNDLKQGKLITIIYFTTKEIKIILGCFPCKMTAFVLSIMCFSALG